MVGLDVLEKEAERPAEGVAASAWLMGDIYSGRLDATAVSTDMALKDTARGTNTLLLTGRKETQTCCVVMKVFYLSFTSQGYAIMLYNYYTPVSS
jgi:hypothetical protein